jgi:hypothetical protein
LVERAAESTALLRENERLLGLYVRGCHHFSPLLGINFDLKPGLTFSFTNTFEWAAAGDFGARSDNVRSHPNIRHRSVRIRCPLRPKGDIRTVIQRDWGFSRDEKLLIEINAGVCRNCNERE